MAPVLPVCLPGLRRSTLCWMPVRTVATPGGRIERRQAGAVNRTLPGPASHINILTNDSKATVSVLYWYRNYPSLEHPLSYFWILRPAPELAQTLRKGRRLELSGLRSVHEHHAHPVALLRVSCLRCCWSPAMGHPLKLERYRED